MKKNILVVLACCIISFLSIAEAVDIPVISIDELRALQQTTRRDFVLIDVEPSVVYNFEHIDGALNMPLKEIDVRYKELPKDKTIITYCHCGSEAMRAKSAAERLISLKFNKVKYLGSPPSAYFEYKKAGYPVAVDLTKFISIQQIQTDAGTPIVISTNIQQTSISSQILPSITPEILYSRIKNHPEDVGKNYIIIDLREKEEYDAGHIPYAQNIPLGKLFSKNKEGKFVFETLPKDKEIFVYCFGGKHRCKIATDELKKSGYNLVYYLKGGFSAWQEKRY